MANTEPLDILIQGIATKWLATAALTSAIAGPWRDERTATATVNPASGSPYPYCVIKIQEDSEVFATSCSSDYWQHTIRFRLYQTSYAACAALAPLVNAVFNSNTLALTLAAGSLVKNRRRRVKYVKETEGVHYAELIYEFQTSYPIQA